ncbi:hypothetical protein TW65_07227 [Stemphylium lycopersici]|nr:hypothetical protein TW65_07227 [Stemphylium lycopersici]
MAPFYAQHLYACLNMGARLTAPLYNLMPIHETVTYPRITVTAENDPCSNRSMSYEHVLSCGHAIVTAAPDEPCAANCCDGSVSASYVPRTECHAWDTAIPQVGDNFFEGMGDDDDDDDDDDDAQEREDEDEARTNTELLPTISAPTNSKPPQTNHSSPISLGEEGHLYLAYTRHAGLNHPAASHAARNREDTPITSSPQRWTIRTEMGKWVDL